MVPLPRRSDILKKLLLFLSTKAVEPVSATSGPPTEPSLALDTSAKSAAYGVEYPLQDYESRLAATVSEQGSAVGCRMQLVNLTKIAEHFGPRWSKVSKKVHVIIKSILDRRLSPADYFVRMGDESYYFLFTGLSEAEAGIKCTLLNREITAKLIGEEAAMAEIDLRSMVVRVDGLAPPATTPLEAVGQLLGSTQTEQGRFGPGVSVSTMLAGRNPLPTAQLKDLLATLETIGHDLRQWQQHQTEARDGSIVTRLEGLDHLLRQAEQAFAEFAEANPASDQDEAARAPASAMAAKPFLVDNWANTTGAARTTPEWQLIDVLPRLIELTLVKIETELKRQADVMGLYAPQAAPPVASVEIAVSHELPVFNWDEAEVIFSYLPMWQVSKKVINSHRCQLALAARDEIYPIESLFDEEIDESVIASLDRLILRRALQDIHLLIKSDRQCNIVVPVHYTTLASSRARREYLGILPLVRPELRPYLIWELISSHIGIYTGPIKQAASLLKPHGRATLLRVPLDFPRFDNLAGSIYAVGADISSQANSEAEAIHKMEAFKSRAEQSGLRAYLHGANSLSLATAAVCAGFDYIDGETIARPIDNPEGIRSYRIEELHAHLTWATNRSGRSAQ